VLTQQSLLSSDRPTFRISPFIKWAGGKAHLIPHLKPLIPSRIKKYYEPFLGGAALFFSTFNSGRSFEAVLSDTNAELVSAFNVVKDSPEELVRHLSKLRKQYLLAPNKERYYYSIRESELIDGVDLAARFIFLNKTCYNGLYRVNRDGKFNVPFGHYRNPRIFNEDNIVASSRAFLDTQARIFSADYKRATEECEAGDFIYFDPPYDPTSKTSTFTSYTPNGFDRDDQARLADWFAELVSRDCNVVLSNSDTEFIQRLYRRYKKISVEVNRPISCKGKGRTGFRELVIFNTPSRART
jgi:DNA adenine methylase